jgi:hypothetical protein
MCCRAIPEDLRGITSLPWPCWSCQSCALDRFSFPRAVETPRPPPPAQRQSPCYAPSCGKIKAESVRPPRQKSCDTCPRCPSPRTGANQPGPMPSLLLSPCTSRTLSRPEAGIDRKHCSRPANPRSSRRGRHLEPTSNVDVVLCLCFEPPHPPTVPRHLVRVD